MGQELILYDPGFTSLPARRRRAWEGFYGEAKAAMSSMDAELLREWAVRSLAIAVDATVGRAVSVWRLVKAMAGGLWQEIKAFASAVIEGRVAAHLKELGARLWRTMKAAWDAIRGAAARAAAFIRSLPSASGRELADYGASLLGGVLGFALIGGRGDGGIIDADLQVFGLGGHRSIWFHSALVGLAGEVCFRSAFELIELLDERTPGPRSPVWRRLVSIGRRFNDALITGMWAGVASHLVIDSHFDGWTPYKDLPISLPNWGHHLIMDVNAAAAGWFGWQWHRARRVFRSDLPLPRPGETKL